MIVAWTGDKLLYGQAQNGINLDLQVKFDIEDQGQSTTKTIGFLTVLRCISGPNLVILTYTSEKLSCGQAQNVVKFDFKVKFDLEDQGRSPPKIIGILTKVFCVSHPNLVILAWTADELPCGQASDWYTHGHTDTQTQAMTIPESQNWPRVKTARMGQRTSVATFGWANLSGRMG